MAPIVEITDVRKHFRVGGLFERATLRAVDGVSLAVDEGETFGLVGESGSGKTTLGRCVIGLQKPSAGTIRVAGHELTALSARELRPLRRHMQMVFQDPYTSLNPRKRIGAAIGEVLRLHGHGQGQRGGRERQREQPQQRHRRRGDRMGRRRPARLGRRAVRENASFAVHRS